MLCRHLLIALLVTCVPPAVRAAELPADPVFDACFRDETLRIDYFHTGNAREEFATLDRLWRQGTWAGSRLHLIDRLGVGRYEARAYDAATGALLFSRGFDSYFGEYATTDEAAKGVRRTYQESVLMPLPKAKIRFTIEVRGRDGARHELLAAEIDPDAWSVRRDPLSAGVTVVEAARHGDPHAMVDIAILAEGYTAAEEGKFRADLARFTRTLFDQEPYVSLADRFNVWGVFTPSQESGCDEPSRGIYRNTALGTTYDSLGSERYLLTEDNRAMRDLAAHAPYDVLYIMVNQTRYGGGGIYNLFCTFVSDNQWSEYVFLHEFGHAFAGLADEYYTSSTAYNDFYPRGVEPVEANITALLDPANLKWRDLVVAGTPLPTPWEKAGFDELDNAYQKVRGELNDRIAARMRADAPDAEVARLKAESEDRSLAHAKQVDAYLARSAWAGKVGAYEGAGYASAGLYRSQVDCIMFSKGIKPFCAACARQIARVVEQYSE
ncbi:MAG: M64 family metallopeptidase [Candidatus Krumholzibacteriia bacterium]